VIRTGCPAIEGFTVELSVVVVGAKILGGGIIIICPKVCALINTHNRISNRFKSAEHLLNKEIKVLSIYLQ
jgi:hypothetical protein